MSARTDALAFRGAKHTCTNLGCGRRFYDLKKLPTPCPYCGTLFVAPEPPPPAALRGGRTSKYAFYKPQQVAEPVEDAAAPEVLPVAEIDDVPDVDADEIPENEDEETLTPDDVNRSDA